MGPTRTCAAAGRPSLSSSGLAGVGALASLVDALPLQEYTAVQNCSGESRESRVNWASIEITHEQIARLADQVLREFFTSIAAKSDNVR